MTRILLVILALIVYGSLYPWQYRPGPDHAPLLVLLHSWPVHIGRPLLGDIAVNLMLYMPVGIFGFLAFYRRGHRALSWIAPVLLGLVVSSSIEMTQIYDRTRDCSLLDVLDNTLGTAVGVAIGYVYRNTLSGANLLVFYWLGFQLSAALGILSGRRALPRPAASPIGALTVIAAWALVLYMSSSESRRWSRWAFGLAVGFSALLVIRGLAPFHVQTQASAFGWIPFFAMFQSEWIVGLPIFLEKSFYYGAAIWLFHQAGWRISRATLLIAALLAGIEWAQRYLPGRTPEITDALLAIILGYLLWLIEQDHQRVILQVHDEQRHASRV